MHHINDNMVYDIRFQIGCDTVSEQLLDSSQYRTHFRKDLQYIFQMYPQSDRLRRKGH